MLNDLALEGTVSAVNDDSKQACEQHAQQVQNMTKSMTSSSDLSTRSSCCCIGTPMDDVLLQVQDQVLASCVLRRAL